MMTFSPVCDDIGYRRELRLIMIRCLAAILFAVVPSFAGADTIALPDETVSSENRNRFRLCRAAVLVEQQAGKDARTVLPPATIEAMREQIEFVMAETIFSLPALTIEDGVKRLKFTEEFVFDFGKTIGRERERLREPAERAAILLECQPILWIILKERIDNLMQWRQRALGIETPLPGRSE